MAERAAGDGPEESESGGGRTGARSWIGPLAVFSLALAIRAIRYPLVVTPHGIDFPFLGDLFYHARRIWFSAVHFPQILSFDRYVSFPDGAEIVWPGVYDWAIAGVARALVGSGPQGAVESVAIWFPPIFGAATAALLAALTARLYGRAAGAWAGGLFALLPASFLFSQLGQLDHHGAVALMATGLLATAIGLLEAPSRPRALALGLATSALIGLWPGALLHVLVVELGLVTWMLWSPDAATAAARAGLLATAQLVAALGLAPFGLGRTWQAYGSWSPWVLSNFQPVWLAATAAALFTAGRVFVRTRLGSTPARRLAVAAGVGALGALAAWLAVPELRSALREASGWFSQAEAFQDNVAELRPLLFPKGVLDVGPLVSEFGLPALLFPLALGGLAMDQRRRGRAGHALLIFFATCFLLLTLNQRRFENTLGVAYAMVWGGALGSLAPRLWRGLAGRRVARTLFALTAVGFVALSLQTLLRYYEPYLGQIAELRRGLDPPRNTLRVQQRLFERAGRFLAAASPPTRGYLDPSEIPEYGVLCNWGAGHLLRYRSERPMVQDNFGVYGGRRTFDRAWDYYAARDEATAVAIAGELRVRYVVADPLGAGSRQPYPPDALARRLAQNFGSLHELPRGRGEVSALVHHRLLFHTSSSARKSLVTPMREPAVSVWEIVRGARVEGTAPPGARVVATLALTTAEGRRHPYRNATQAGDDGHWRLTLPYPTDRSFSPAVRAGSHYRLEAGPREARLEVPEAAVRAGARVRGPDL